MSRSRWLALLLLIAIGRIDLSAQCASGYYAVNSARSVGITTSCLYPADISAAVSYWTDACLDIGISTPHLHANQTGEITVDVVLMPGRSSGGCGLFDHSLNGNTVTGGTIRIWEQQSDGQSCLDNLPEIIAHEIGHVLGLANAPGCEGYIMGPPSWSYARSVQQEECAQFDTQWTMYREGQDACETYCKVGCSAAPCPPPDYYTPPAYISPIILDLDGNGFHLSSFGDGVAFDLNADDSLDRTSWTSAGTGDAFLVLDRDGDALIDDGRELFGTATLLASGGVAPNGYIALREFDDFSAGGNGDGIIDSSNPVWPELQVWTDSNHDGTSQPGELRSLDDAGIVALDTQYLRSNRTDKHGNFFRFKSKVSMRGRGASTHAATTYDVFFVVETGGAQP